MNTAANENPAFIMDAQLEKDTFLLGALPLCFVALMNNASYPWVVLVPRKGNVTEIMDLSTESRIKFIEEVNIVAEIMRKTYWPDKMNIATLGNQVAQLHMHIIARFKTDDAWPEPVWGKKFKPYTDEGAEKTISILKRELGKLHDFSPAE